MRGEFKSMRRVSTVHVIDVLFVGGDDVRQLDFKMRNEIGHLLVAAVNKRVRNDYVVMRAKAAHGLENLPQVMEQMKLRLLKGSGARLRVTIDLQDQYDEMPRFVMYSIMCWS